jgi:16S rRNA processing protein RimM
LSTPPGSSLVCIGIIAGAHGIRGAVRVKSLVHNPEDLGAYGAVTDESGKRQFRVKIQGVSKGLALVALDGVSDRNQAEALKGLKLYVDRSLLPVLDEDEFLVADLVGCQVVSPSDQALGVVSQVCDFGAGELLEIVGKAGTFMVPFTRASVPQVDVGAKRLVVVPPVYAPDEKGEKEGFDQEIECGEVP